MINVAVFTLVTASLSVMVVILAVECIGLHGQLKQARKHYGHIYELSREELERVWKYVDKLEKEGKEKTCG